MVNCINDLPKGIQKLVNAERLRQHELTSCPRLSGAFTWHTSRRGNDFWRRIAKGDYAEYFRTGCSHSGVFVTNIKLKK